MRAIILATGYHPNLSPLSEHKPTPMLRIIDRPIIEHLIEHLSYPHFKEFHIVLSHHPEMVENHLDGRRWGIDIVYHLVRDPLFPFATLKPQIQQWEDETVLVGIAEVLPTIDVQLLQQEKHVPTLLFSPKKIWTGWGVFPVQSLLSREKSSISDWLNPNNHSPFKVSKAQLVFAIENLKDLLGTNIHALSQETGLHFPATARTAESNVWISRNVTIHSTAQIIPPVFIGEHSQIASLATIGPNVVIENRCLIDSRSTIQNSLVCQESYVGQGLMISNSIVDQNLLINLSLETSIHIKENFILGEMHTPSFKKFLFHALGRFLSALLLTVFLPFIGMIRLFRDLHRHPCVQLPAQEDSQNWETFDLLSFKKKGDIHPPGIPKGFINSLPLLFNLVKGQIHFTGVQPRTVKEVKKLPKDWREVYLKSQAGFITLASVELLDNAANEEIYFSEAYYTTRFDFSDHIKLIFRWLWKSL